MTYNPVMPDMQDLPLTIDAETLAALTVRHFSNKRSFNELLSEDDIAFLEKAMRTYGQLYLKENSSLAQTEMDSAPFSSVGPEERRRWIERFKEFRTVVVRTQNFQSMECCLAQPQRTFQLGA